MRVVNVSVHPSLKITFQHTIKVRQIASLDPALNPDDENDF